LADEFHAHQDSPFRRAEILDQAMADAQLRRYLPVAIEEVAAMLRRRFDNIVTYLKHRITNATSESINAKVRAAAASRHSGTPGSSSVLVLMHRDTHRA